MMAIHLYSEIGMLLIFLIQKLDVHKILLM